MTRYTVVWEKKGDAVEQLAQIWLDAKNSDAKQEINRAANRIDKELSTDASSKGDALSEGLRAITILPLRIVLWVDEARRKVMVESVRVVSPK